jgi:hypothetical protein
MDNMQRRVHSSQAFAFTSDNATLDSTRINLQSDVEMAQHDEEAIKP